MALGRAWQLHGISWPSIAAISAKQLFECIKDVLNMSPFRPELVDGPIIEQGLVRAVEWHSEHRVILNAHKTVIFR